MAYESTLSAESFAFFGEAPEASHTKQRIEVASAAERTDDNFRRAERMVVVIGASVGGMLAGFVAAIAFGRLPIWAPMAAALPLFLAAFYFAMVNFRDALSKRAYGCVGASVLSGAALLAWPVTAFMFPMSAFEYWIAPIGSMVSLLLLASCWSCNQRAVYRFCAQGAMVAVGVSYLGAITIF